MRALDNLERLVGLPAPAGFQMRPEDAALPPEHGDLLHKCGWSVRIKAISAARYAR